MIRCQTDVEMKDVVSNKGEEFVMGIKGNVFALPKTLPEEISLHPVLLFQKSIHTLGPVEGWVDSGVMEMGNIGMRWNLEYWFRERMCSRAMCE